MSTAKEFYYSNDWKVRPVMENSLTDFWIEDRLDLEDISLSSFWMCEVTESLWFA